MTEREPIEPEPVTAMRAKLAERRIPWEALPVHPAAESLPMMGDAELAELAADIKANGMQEPIVLWRDNTEQANGAKGPFPLYLLDGRNRLAALKLLGIDDPEDAPKGRITDTTVRTLDAVGLDGIIVGGRVGVAWRPNVDPATFVLSLNVHRRHLTSEQKRQAIAAYLKADPTSSDRKVAKELGVDNKTAAKVRADLEAREEIPHVPTRTDSAERKQPATKRKPTPKPKATPNPEPIDEDTIAEQPITTVPPGGLTENSPGQTDRVKQALENAKAARDAAEPAPDDSDTGSDLGIGLSGIAADLDKLADYVTALDTDARLKVLDDHVDAIKDVSRKLLTDDQGAEGRAEDPRAGEGGIATRVPRLPRDTPVVALRRVQPRQRPLPPALASPCDQ